MKEYLPLRLLIIQGTPFCNINCSYCYLPNRNSKRRISLATVKKNYENIFESNIVKQGFSTVWHAGEPLMMPIAFYEEVIGIVRSLNKYGYRISQALQTNGTLINQEWCDFIKCHEEVSIGVSIDGPSFIHDRQRVTRHGKGTYQSTMRGIRMLQENQIPFHVITVITNESLKYPDELFEFYINNNILQVAFNFEEVEGINKTSSLNETECL